MTDTAQPATAAETVVASDPIENAANAFKAELGQIATPEKRRDEQGRFAPTQPEAAEEEIEAEAEGEIPEADAESHDEEETGEAAEEAQPDPVDLPASWPSEKAELWQTLPPEAQAVIAEREGQRDAAVNAKFQEAANLRKAHEAEIIEAQTNGQKFVEAAEFVLQLAQPQRPARTMLDPSSSDYNPDAYHLANAQYEEQSQLLGQIAQQREQILAQQAQAAEARRLQQIGAIEEAHRPELLKLVPAFAGTDVAAKHAAAVEIIDYAKSQGIPEEYFQDLSGITSADLKIAWKAMQYDKMQKAKATVQPKAAKPAAPPVRPGVASSKSGIENAKRKGAFDRLARSGSVEDGAAVWKQFLKG
jgi:hypothetical protein